MRLPVKVSDNYEVIVVTDAGNVVYEHGGEDNNRAVDDATILVATLPRPDLTVSEIVAPDRESAGATESGEFKVVHQGLEAEHGPCTDPVRMSLDDKPTRPDHTS